MDVPFVAFSNDELEDKEEVGEFVVCPNCKKIHKVEYGDKVLEDGTLVPSKLLAFVTCTENSKMYLVGIKGKFI